MFSCAVLALLGVASALPSNVKQVQTRVDKDTYDYVIVGGGVTGLVVANRLSENKNSKSTSTLLSLHPHDANQLFHRNCPCHRSW
jgi:NADH dehydrogenase FAD-containing subunit